MRGETRERWIKLCNEAATEQELERLLELTQEINRLLDEKEARLRAQGIKPPAPNLFPGNQFHSRQE